jgi:DmsA/YnfE family anaerobic dimethyl sulfoxide reductase A subunit
MLFLKSLLNKKKTSNDEERMIRTCCPAHNCGGRCLLKVTVKGGIITRIGTDDREGDSIADPQRRACTRGLSYRGRQYHPDRLKFPMKRIGKRGEAKFKRISWDEALDEFTGQLQRIKKQYGNSALYIPYGTGSYNQTNGKLAAVRLLHKFGGCLSAYNSYSWACISKATPYVYGTKITGNQRQDWINSKYILMWGWNPAEMRDGTNSDFIIKKARQNGAKTVCVDPRMSMSAVSLADQWIPIRPGTDVAMMSAMAYVMISEELYDADFVKKYCCGFDSSQMPDGLENVESYRDYIFGTKDGIPKTPGWASGITGISPDTIIQVAREYATIKPGVLYQGYGMQRRAYGEQVVRAGCVLAALTGNVGISGGWASGIAMQAPDGGPLWEMLPTEDNPIQTSIPTFLWTEAVIRGTDMGVQDGVIGAEKLDNSIKLIYAVASNALINQHANINRTARILEDESLVEYLVVQDNFLTPTGRYADLLLPACTQFETIGVQDGWKYGEEILLGPKIVEPPFEARSDYDICADLAGRLGIGDEFTLGRNERDWVAKLLEEYKSRRFPDMPLLDEFERSNCGIYSQPVTRPAIAFEDFRFDPDKHPLPTPSGKIEIFSGELYEMNNPDEIPALPKYIQEWESPFGPEAESFPLQAIGHHMMGRVHSTHANVASLQETFPHTVHINPLDAQDRKLDDGEQVKVYNQRGAMILPCKVTGRIMPGVVDIPQGAWWQPDEKGIDLGGSVNVLTSERWTPLAFGNAQHTIMVQVEKLQEGG